MRIELENIELRDRLGAYTASNMHGTNPHASNIHHNTNIHASSYHQPTIHSSSHHNNSIHASNIGHNSLHNGHNSLHNGGLKQRAMADRREGFNSAELRKLGRLQTLPPPASAFYSRLGTKSGSRNGPLFICLRWNLVRKKIGLVSYTFASRFV